MEPELNDNLANARRQLMALVTDAAATQRDCGLAIASEEYLRDVLHCGLIEVVHEWALGMPFEEICKCVACFMLLTNFRQGCLQFGCLCGVERCCVVLLHCTKQPT